QGGLGMPDRDYYLKTDDKTKAIRAAYLTHVEKMFALLGEPAQRAAAHARSVLDLETRLARASKPRVALRDPYGNYHLMTRAVMEDFHFSSTVLSGVAQIRPRWERVQEMTDHLLGDLLGQLYVARAFPPQAKVKAEALVNNLKAALHDRLETLDWMSAQTRQQA